MTPGDGRMADFDDDGVPEVAIGRLPVVSTGELAAAIDDGAHQPRRPLLAQVPGLQQGRRAQGQEQSNRTFIHIHNPFVSYYVNVKKPV